MEFVLEREKRPYEIFQIGVDFTADVGDVDNIVSTSTTVKDLLGVDVTGTMMANPVLASKTSKFDLQAGVAGTDYRAVFQVTTAAGHKYEHSVYIRIRENA